MRNQKDKKVDVIFRKLWYESVAKRIIPKQLSMNELIFGGLHSPLSRTAHIIGIAFIVLFGISAIMLGPDYGGVNAPALDNSENSDPN